MKKEIKTVTIGIPAFNEEANIGFLLKCLTSQKCLDFEIKEIIVVSDKSDDATNSIVRSFGGKVKLLRNAKRSGQAKSQNKIIKHSSADVLVLLNGDVIPVGKLFISKLINPILRGKADLTSARVLPVKPSAVLERILSVSVDAKRSIFELNNHGNNIYTCHGRCRAFSKKLYKKMTFKFSVNEDAYSYLFAKSNGYVYKYVKNSTLLYKLPTSFKDHQKQSSRFLKARSALRTEFGDAFVNEEYSLPFLISVQIFFRYLLYFPLHVISYLSIVLFIMAVKKRDIAESQIWSVSKSSKKVK